MVLRNATADDCEFVWTTNNDPAVRAVSMSAAEIPWRDHVQWYKQVLSDDDRHLLIAQLQGCDIGVIRFDVREECVVSVALAAEFRGRGLGRTLIATGTHTALERWTEVVVAWVRPDNFASARAFESAGYTQVGREVVNDIEMLRMEAR